MTGSRSTSERIISKDRLPEPMTIEARNSSTGTPGLAQDPADLLPAAQVGRELLLLAAQTAQVDDPLAPRGLRGLAEVRGCLPVLLLE